jgi:ribose-phosphate pyrophosphokinase
VLVDDMIDTAGSVATGARVLKDRGASSVYVCATHGVFSPPAFERIAEAPIEEVIVTNSIPLPDEQKHGKIRQLSVAPLFGRAIRNVYEDESVSELFDPNFEL